MVEVCHGPLARRGGPGQAAEAFPLSSVQREVWLADRAAPGTAAQHIGRVADLGGSLDTGALAAALSEVCQRHEALRTAMLPGFGPPLQHVISQHGTGQQDVILPVADVAAADAQALAAALAARPFAAGGPLWRAELHRLGPHQHRLVLVFHQLVADAATVAMLLAELAASYRARRGGADPGLPDAVPYSAYLRWERAFASGPELAGQLGYWTRQLAGYVPPPARPRHWAVPAGRPGGLAGVRIQAADADLLRALASATGATTAEVMLACFAAVLYRCGAPADLVIGTPVSVRPGPSWACAAGLYTRTLPIRVRMAADAAFADLLRQVRGTLLAALSAADVPMAQVRAAVCRGGAGRPLYEVTCTVTGPGEQASVTLPGLATRVSAVYGGQASTDLHLEIADGGQGSGLTGVLEYDAALFTPGSAGRLADGIAALAGHVAASPARSLSHLPSPLAAPGPAAARPA